MKDARKNLHGLLLKHLDPSLQAAGFARIGQSFVKRFPNENLGFFWLQWSKTDTEWPLHFRVMYGICWLQLFQLEYPTGKPTTLNCHVGGVLQDETAHSWWVISSIDAAGAVSKKLALSAATSCLPWFEMNWQDAAIEAELVRRSSNQVMPIVWRKFLERRATIGPRTYPD